MVRRFWPLVFGLCWMGSSVGVQADEASSAFESVCERLRAVKQVETDFAEEKTLHILTHPLKSTGSLLFSPDKGVYRVTREPLHQELLITHSQLLQKDSQGNIQSLAVRSQPEARVFIDVFLSFFSGDNRAWEKSFDTTFSGSVGDWEIQFRPRRRSPAAKALRGITLKGHDGVLDAMTLEEANGDITRTAYEHQRLFLKSDAGEPATPFPLTLTSP